jgi:hypothetical protein
MVRFSDEAIDMCRSWLLCSARAVTKFFRNCSACQAGRRSSAARRLHVKAAALRSRYSNFSTTQTPSILVLPRTPAVAG